MPRQSEADSSPIESSELAALVRRFHEHPGLGGKAALRLLSEFLGPTDWVRGPGDDAAAIPHGGGFLLAGGEAIWPPFIEADPFAAGAGAVIANVNDLAAMGGRVLGLVDTVVGPEPVARRVLEGLAFASTLYGAPVVGGHLTIREGPASLSCFGVGQAFRLLSARNVAPGQALLVACSLEGRMRDDFPFYSSLRERGSTVGGDLQVLPAIAEAGVCVAAKDVSMAGFLGSLAMLLEATGSGAAVDLERFPRPADVLLDLWMFSFPSFAFLLCTPPGAADDCRAAFTERGLACEAVGAVDGTGELRARLGGSEALLLDLKRQGVTGLAAPRG